MTNEKIREIEDALSHVWSQIAEDVLIDNPKLQAGYLVSGPFNMQIACAMPAECKRTWALMSYEEKCKVAERCV